MGLADYLAKNYLSADGPSPSAKPSKKRKRKAGAASESAGLIIAEDDVPGWTKTTGTGESDDEDGPLIVNPGAKATTAKRTTWKTVGVAAPSNTEQETADAISAAASAEATARAADDDDAPTVADGSQMASGAAAGSQTAAQVTAALRKREEAEKAEMVAAGSDPSGKAQETIYRDASGRVVNVAMKRAEMRRAAEEKERKEREEKEGARGDVQRREREERRRELEAAGTKGVARYADDVELNEEMRERRRWNDPAAAFLSSKSEGEGKGGTAGKKAGSRKKVYQGAAEPNRYGIRPGYRWDGVDRSNGFERKWFAARNRVQNRKELEYAWQLDE